MTAPRVVETVQTIRQANFPHVSLAC